MKKAEAKGFMPKRAGLHTFFGFVKYHVYFSLWATEIQLELAINPYAGIYSGLLCDVP